MLDPPRKMSLKGLAQGICEEAIVLFVYRDKDTKGVWHSANGIGNNDDNLDTSTRITIEQAVAQYLENFKRFEAAVNRSITRQDIRQNEFDALGLRAFNSGVRGFEEGEKVLIDAVNAKDARRVCQEMIADGNLKRRVHEAALFMDEHMYIDASKCRLYEKLITDWRLIPNPLLAEAA